MPEKHTPSGGEPFTEGGFFMVETVETLAKVLEFIDKYGIKGLVLVVVLYLLFKARWKIEIG